MTIVSMCGYLVTHLDSMYSFYSSFYGLLEAVSNLTIVCKQICQCVFLAMPIFRGCPRGDVARETRRRGIGPPSPLYGDCKNQTAVCSSISALGLVSFVCYRFCQLQMMLIWELSGVSIRLLCLVLERGSSLSFQLFSFSIGKADL